MLGKKRVVAPFLASSEELSPLSSPFECSTNSSCSPPHKKRRISPACQFYCTEQISPLFEKSSSNAEDMTFRKEDDRQDKSSATKLTNSEDYRDFLYTASTEESTRAELLRDWHQAQEDKEEQEWQPNLCPQEELKDSLAERHRLVTWALLVADECRLSPFTSHAAIAMFDKLILLHSAVRVPRLWKLFMSCTIFICAKFHEVDGLELRNSFSILKDRIEFARCRNDIIELERIVLSEIDWEVSAPTAQNFIEFYGSREGFTVFEDIAGRTIASERMAQKMRRLVIRRASFFCEVYLTSNYSWKFPAFILGAACIIAARHFVDVNASIEPQLFLSTSEQREKLLAACYKDLSECICDMISSSEEKK